MKQKWRRIAAWVFMAVLVWTGIPISQVQTAKAVAGPPKTDLPFASIGMQCLVRFGLTRTNAWEMVHSLRILSNV